MKITCNVIESLLPLYADDLVSEDSIALVEEHLQNCEKCQTTLKELQEGGTKLFDSDELTGENLAMSNTLVKIKKSYHWFLMNIGFAMFLISIVSYFVLSGLINEVMYISGLKEILAFNLFSCTLAFSLFLMVARFLYKNKTLSQKDTINKITIISSISLPHFMIIFSIIGYSYNFIYDIGSILALYATMIYIGLAIYRLYNLSFTTTDTYYIQNAIWFLVVIAGIMMFDKFKVFVYWTGWTSNTYWYYSNTFTVVSILTLSLFAIKLHNFDIYKPKQVVTKEFKLLQLAMISVGIFLQAFCVLFYTAKFGDNFSNESFITMIRFMIDISNYLMIPLTLVLPYCVHLILKQKQYVMVWIMLQTIALLYQKVELLDIILGNMDDPAYLTLGVFWVFYLTLVPTAIYTVKLKNQN